MRTGEEKKESAEIEGEDDEFSISHEHVSSVRRRDPFVRELLAVLNVKGPMWAKPPQ